MDFGLSEEQDLLQQTIKGLVEGECPPVRVREIFESDTGFDETLWKGMVEMGLAGLAIPDAYGGAGLEILDLALAAETLGEGAAPGPFLGHALAGLAIAWAGSDAQKQKWLPKLATGDVLASIALAEGEGAWQPEAWTLGGDTLTGAKRFVPYAGQADLLVVGTAGGGFALVERGASGLAIEPYPGVDRTRRLGDVRFEATPCEALPGTDQAERLRDTALVLLAADALGGASRCVAMSVDYAKTREQFGVTIGHFQALKHQLVDMAVSVEPARALVWYAAHAQDHVPDDASHAAAVAKAHVTDRFMQVARDAVEAHGGIGFTWECDVQIWFKRAMFDRAMFGAPSFHRERAAATW